MNWKILLLIDNPSLNYWILLNNLSKYKIKYTDFISNIDNNQWYLIFSDFYPHKKNIIDEFNNLQNEIEKSNINYFNLCSDGKIFLTKGINIKILNNEGKMTIDINKGKEIKKLFISEKNIDKNYIDYTYYDKYEIPEYYLLNQFYKKNYCSIFSKSIPYLCYQNFIKDKDNFYHIILTATDKNINEILNLKINKYYNYRITIFNFIKQKDNELAINIWSKKHNGFLINICSFIHLILNVIINKTLYFEYIIWLNPNISYNNIDFNKLNEIFKYKKLFYTKGSFSCSADLLCDIPFNSSLYKDYDIDYNKLYHLIRRYLILNNQKVAYPIINKEQNYKLIKTNNMIINEQNNLMTLKSYKTILDQINMLLPVCTSLEFASKYIIRKFSVSVLCDDEKEIKEIEKVVENIINPSLLWDMLLLVEAANIQSVKLKILQTILKLAMKDNEKFDNKSLICFDKLIKTTFNQESIPIIVDFMVWLYDKQKLDSNKIKTIIFRIFPTLIRTKKSDDYVEKINQLINKVFSMDDILNMSKLETLEKFIDNKNVFTDFVIYLTCNFTPYYNDFEQFLKEREKLKNNLEQLLKLNLNTYSLDRIIYFNVSNFYLSYQGIPSTELFKLKSDLIRKICPDLSYSIDTNFNNSKIKVLFLCSFFIRRHSVFKDRHQVIKNLANNNKFEVYFATYDNLNSENLYQFGRAKHIKLERSLENNKKVIGSLNLDYLVFCEIGMDLYTYFLAHMRLAKVQINTWGHSDTSGIDTIDYFFSSKLYELDYEESQTHYSEKLVLQDSLCTCYVNPTASYISSFKSRNHFGFSDESIIYFCAQSMFKFNPIFDDYIISILKNVPNAILLMLNSDNKDKVISRWSGHNIVQRIHVLQMMPHHIYTNVMNISDVILDPYPFGGCNSSLEAFSLGKVVVTQPSQMINGRFTHGFYKYMDLENMVCNSKEEYINMATKLGQDINYRKELESKIKEKSSVLFMDKGTLNDWTNDLIRLRK